MKAYWPVLLLLVIVGCGDSGTKSLETEVDSLKSQNARLKEENAALRERANALSLDLDYQKSLNKELQGKLKAPQVAKEPEKGLVEPASKPKPFPREQDAEAPRVSSEGRSEPKPPVTATPERIAVVPVLQPEEHAAPAPKPRSLPDIRPKTAAQKTEPAPIQPSAATEAEKPEAPSQPAPSVKVTKPEVQADDPYAAFKKPGFREPVAAEPDETPAKPKPKKPAPVEQAEESTEASAPSAPAPSTENPEPVKPSAPRMASPRVSAPLSELQLVDVAESRAGSAVHISGHIANNTNKGIINVRVRAEFLDANGGLISSREYSVGGGTRLDAGESASFEIASPPNPHIAKYRLTALGDQSR